MKHERYHISGKERTFSPDEFIVSKTDAKGLITYANDVFLKVANYSIEEVLGKPHNIIRHPWMPRCVFALLWERIKTGQEIFAYVVNRGKYGDYYWVLAHVTPSYNAKGELIGYHSNRRAPNPEIIAQIEPVYKALRAIELEAESSQQGLIASKKALQQWIEERGGNYDEIILSL